MKNIQINKITQEASALVEFIIFTKIGPKVSHRIPTSVITMKHEIIDIDTGVRLEKAAGPQLLLFVPVVLVILVQDSTAFRLTSAV